MPGEGKSVAAKVTEAKLKPQSSARRLIVVPILIVISCLTVSARLAIAQTCGAAGCTSGPTNYNTNQGGNAFYCLDTACQSNGSGCKSNSPVTEPYLTVPPNTDTLVAADDAGAYSPALWNYGVTGQVLITNPDILSTAIVTMTLYYGPFCATNDCFLQTATTSTLGPGEADWIPFSNLITSADPDYGYAFYVFLRSSAKLRCVAETYYTWEHD
jgi:hypothetical protein